MSTNTLFDMVPVCFHCDDLGFTLRGAASPVNCFRVAAGAQHNAPNDAAGLIRRSVDCLFHEGQTIDPHLFEIAKILSRSTTDRPCRRDRLVDANFNYSKNPLRAFHKTIERLRGEWLLPVGSRKEEPSGYWIITEMSDFSEWLKRSKSAPITQLSNIFRVAKRNFPVFAEQMELEFWSDVSSESAALDDGPDVTFADAPDLQQFLP